MIFRNRVEAGKRLGEVLAARKIDRPVILGIPRGGIPVAAEVARATGGTLAAIVARKLGAPGNPELAIGATTADGVYCLDPHIAHLAGADDAYLARELEAQSREAARREEMFDSHRRPDLKERTVIVVDDGVATGSTAIASLRSVKAAGASRVILAIPVAPPSSIEVLEKEADEVVCLSVEENFWAVGQFYDEFDPVEDDEVRRILHEFAPVVAGDPSRTFSVQRGDVRLAGRLSLPAGPGPFPCVAFVHGLGSGKDSPRNVVIAEALVDAGIAAVLFDLSGHGESSLDPRRGEEPFVDDLAAVWDWMQSQPELAPDRLGVAGSSLGAVIAMQAAVDGRTHPATMVLRAPPAEPEQFRRLHVASLVLIGSHDPLLYDVRAGIRQCTECELSVVDGASHLFEEPGTLEEAVKRTVDWFKRMLLPAVSIEGAGESAVRRGGQV